MKNLKFANMKKTKSVFYNFAHIIYDIIKYTEYLLIFIIARMFPLKDRIVASAFNGKKYGDNTKYIIEKYHEISPSTDLIWLCDPDYDYEVPDYVTVIKCSVDKKSIKRAFIYFTSKIWIDTHLYEKYLIKRKGQYVIETWHGGLGIKKIEGDVEKFNQNRFQIQKIRKTSKLSDVFISNSKFLSDIYRRAFFFDKKILEVGFPKDDIVINHPNGLSDIVKQWFSIDQNKKIIVYAPTYRGDFEDSGTVKTEPYDLDMISVLDAFEQLFKSECVFLIRWHPSMSHYMDKVESFYSSKVLDASSYPEMQHIICAADAFVSDYSSCLFEAATRDIPCFIYANDFDSYLGDRGSYFKLSELPFPSATSNKQMLHNIIEYNHEKYEKKWNDFAIKMGLNETGNSASVIVELINKHLSQP